MRGRFLSLGALGLLACVTPLDRSPPKESFRRSREALEQGPDRVVPLPGPVFVGWGKAPIDAPAGISLAGYGSRAGIPSTGVHDPCFARALAVRTGEGPPVLWIVADILLVDQGTQAAVSAALAEKVHPDRIVFGATHTHGGPGGYVDGFFYSLVLGPARDDAKAAVVQAMTQAASEALAALAPGRIAFGEIEAPGLSTNRVRKSGAPTDPVLGLILAERASDGARGVLLAFGAHATTVSDTDLELTADYPGALTAALEGRGFAFAAFTAGAVGSMSPRAGWSEHPGAAWMAARLEAAVRAGLPAIARGLRGERALSVRSFEVTLPRRQWRISSELAIPLIGQALAPTALRVIAVSMGRDTWVSLPVELSGEISARVRDRARRTGELLVVSVFGGGYGGYVVPREAYDLPEEEKGEMADYESRLMSFYGPWMGELFSAATWRAMRSASAAIEEPARGRRGAFVRVAPPPIPPPPEPPR